LREKASNADPSTGCEENIKLAAIWLSRCLTKHEFCTISIHPYPPLPTRVLDVELLESPDDICLRLTEGCHGPYITLSHVWGMAPIITTTLSTLANRMVNVSMGSMPQTFRDAVRIAREMAVRYLWIDSLCIIQDCSEDWTNEASKMGEYYKNSLFTIAAVSAPDGSSGCFVNRNPLALTPCPIDIHFPGITETVASMFVRLNTDWDPVDRTSGFQRPPLWQRAWVVQERLLSSRILRFSDMQLSWICRTEEASERVPEGTSRLIETADGGRVLRHALLGLKKFTLTDIVDDKLSSEVNPASGTDAELMGLYNAWYDLVTLYGKCKLTKEADIFPAISGVATAISNSTGDKYVAGLWQHDLHRGLLWTAPDSTNALTDLRKYRAPSWSWASLKGTCNFHVRQILQSSRVRTGLFTIERAQSHASSKANPFGEIASGELRIAGLLKCAHPKGVDGEQAFRQISQDEDRQSLFDLEQGVPVGFYYPDNIDRKYLAEIWCSPVITEERGGYPSGGHRIDAQCLALYPLNKVDSIYMRVGFVWVQDFSWFNGLTKSLFCII
jgi:Heterokaryon incompatibility protein (HET)